MPQSTDFSLSNQSRSALRAELNSILAALASLNSGSSAPNTGEGRLWLDTNASPWVLKMHDGVSGWTPIAKIDPSADLFRLSGNGDANELQGVPTVKQIQNGLVNAATTGGSNNAYTLDLGAGLRPASYAANQRFYGILNHTDDGSPAPTLNVTGSAGTGLGAKNIVMPDGTAPPAGVLASGLPVEWVYDGTNMVIASPPGSMAFEAAGDYYTAAEVDAALEGVGSYASNGYKTGRYHFGFGHRQTNATVTVDANKLYARPFIAGAPFTFDRVGINVVSAVSGNARIGLYEWADGGCGALISDLGVVTTGSTGLRSLTISQAVTPGVYGLGVVFDATPEVRRAGAVSSILSHYLGDDAYDGSGTNAVGISRSFTYGSLPNPFGGTPALVGDTGMPGIFFWKT